MSRSSCEPVRGASDAAPSTGQEPRQQRGEKRRHKPKHHQSRLLNSTYVRGPSRGPCARRGRMTPLYHLTLRRNTPFRCELGNPDA